MSTLTLILPPLRRIAHVERLETLSYWISRGDNLPDVKPGRDVAIRECFNFIGTSIPVAALTRDLDAGDAIGSGWLRADPAWVSADAVTLRMLACGNIDLSPADSDVLANALRPLFGDSGFPLEPALPSRWYLRCPSGAKLPIFANPEDVLGDDLANHLPDGVEGKRWRQLLNEVQIILHNHPLNIERARRGLTPVNSLWFWGAGQLPDWVRTEFSRVSTDDPLIAALASRARVDCMTIASNSFPPGNTSDHVLIDLGQLRDADVLEKNWLAMFADALTQANVSEIRCKFETGQRLRIKPSHRWRFWRRQKKLGIA